MKQATFNYVTRITRYIMLKFCGMCEKSGLCRPPWKTPNTKLINWSWSQSLRTITMSLLLTSHLLASTYLKLWHSNHWVGDSDATVGVGQSCTVHYREEEHATPLYKAWKPVPPGSVPGHPLLPHWDFQTVSLCPSHLPSLWSEGSQRCFCSSTVLSSSLSLLGREGHHILPGLL